MVIRIVGEVRHGSNNEPSRRINSFRNSSNSRDQRQANTMLKATTVLVLAAYIGKTFVTPMLCTISTVHVLWYIRTNALNRGTYCLMHRMGKWKAAEAIKSNIWLENQEERDIYSQNLPKMTIDFANFSWSQTIMWNLLLTNKPASRYFRIAVLYFFIILFHVWVINWSSSPIIVHCLLSLAKKKK
jgi:hypothetical protein